MSRIIIIKKTRILIFNFKIATACLPEKDRILSILAAFYDFFKKVKCLLFYFSIRGVFFTIYILSVSSFCHTLYMITLLFYSGCVFTDIFGLSLFFVIPSVSYSQNIKVHLRTLKLKQIIKSCFMLQLMNGK